MKITIESTDTFTRIEGKLCRVWKGKTERGISCDVAVACLRGRTYHELVEFESELKEIEPPVANRRVIDFAMSWEEARLKVLEKFPDAYAAFGTDIEFGPYWIIRANWGGIVANPVSGSMQKEQDEAWIDAYVYAVAEPA